MAYGPEFQLSVILVDNLSSGFIYSASLVYVGYSTQSQFSSKFFMVQFSVPEIREIQAELNSWKYVINSWIWIENWNIFKCDGDTLDKR